MDSTIFTNQAIMLEIAAPKAAASSCGESVSQGGERRTAADNAWYEISLTMPTEPLFSSTILRLTGGTEMVILLGLSVGYSCRRSGTGCL